MRNSLTANAADVLTVVSEGIHLSVDAHDLDPALAVALALARDLLITPNNGY
jgi:hypothetical protein